MTYEKKVTKEMMDAFNNRDSKPKQWTLGSIKSQYLTSINKSQDNHDQFYDSKLVEEVSGQATVIDLNIDNVLLSRSLKYWGIFVACAVFYYVLSQLMTFDNSIVKFTAFILSLIVCAFMFSVLYKSIKGFVKTVGSSRDTKFKLLSMIQILPIILIVLYMIVFYGVASLLLSVVFLIFGGLGYFILVWLDWDDILDWI